MARARLFAALVISTAAVALAGPPVAAQKDAAVADLLRATAEYAAAYAPRVSGVTLDEQYTLLDVSGGRVVTTRRLSSDLVILNASGRVLALRDAYSLDDNALREHTPRITTLLAKPSQAAWDQAQAYAGESYRHQHDELILRVNDPMLPLQFLSAANQAKVTWKIDGKKKINGVETVGLRFQEPKSKDSTYIVETRGKAATNGRFWVDPANGEIHRTELAIQSQSEFARIAVDYSRDAKLSLLLPSAMTDTYEVSEVVGSGMSNMGAGSPGIARRSFDCRASYGNPRLTPINLVIQQ